MAGGPQRTYMHSDGPPVTCIPFSLQAQHEHGHGEWLSPSLFSPALAGFHQCLVILFSLLTTILFLMQFLSLKTYTFGLGSCKAQIR